LSNLISNDKLVSSIFAAVTNHKGEPKEKLEAVIRAGKIAEAFAVSWNASEAVNETFKTTQS
jgi:hypothetical protein